MVVVAGACARTASNGSAQTAAPATRPRVRPGITVLLEDSLQLVRGKRIGLLTNQTGIDEHGTSDIDLLRGATAASAGVRLTVLFSPEHGIRGTEDHEEIASGVDAKSGLPIVSLYTRGTVPPPDSTLVGLDALVFDLQDVGTRTWTYVGAMLYAMRAAQRHGIPFIVLDRPNPIGGVAIAPPMLDTALAGWADPGHGAAKAYAVYPFPLRHGMTMGELARFYDGELAIGADLHVVPAAGWQRREWLDDAGLPWVKPSPNLPDLTSVLLYPSIVAFEGSNVSVGRGTRTAFQRVGAPWMKADDVARRLEARRLPGVRFVAEPFTPVAPGDDKYGGLTIPGVRVEVTNRQAVESGRIAAALYWAIRASSPDSLRIRPVAFDERFGSTAVREAIDRGADPDSALAAARPAVEAFIVRARRYYLYH